LENFKFSGQLSLLPCSTVGAGYGNSCCTVEIFPSSVIYLRPETHPNDRQRNPEIVSSRQSESPRRLVVPVKFDFLAHDAVLPRPNSLVVLSNLLGTCLQIKTARVFMNRLGKFFCTAICITSSSSS